MSHSSISSLLSTTIDALTTTSLETVYLRASEHDANQQLHDVDITNKIVLLWNNLVPISVEGSRKDSKVSIEEQLYDRTRSVYHVFMTDGSRE